MKRRAVRDESGAVAIIFALMAVMLLSLAALGTDIGNEVGRKSATQNQADFGAFAAVGKMTQTGHLGDTPSPAVLSAIADSMNANQPQDDKLACWRTKTCVTTSQLTDASLTNGDVRYTADGLQVTAPNHYVSFGLARVMGFQGTYVGATATVNIFSPGLRVLPMFAVQGCDYGLQTLADPANGHDAAVVPTLAYDSDQNSTVLSTLALLDSTNNPINSLPLNSTGNQLQLTASKWTKTTKIGFFRSDNTDPTLVQTQPTFWLMGDSAKKALAPYSFSSTSTVQLNIPDAVAQTEGVWWVRVYNEDTKSPDVNTWSTRSEALPIRVGNAVLQCASGSSDGNFGTLVLPRTVPSANSSWLPVNIANGLQSPLSLTVHQQYALDYPKGKCTDGVAGAITSPGNSGYLNAGTNCVSTDTGLAANDATQGLITGSSGYPGLLTTAGTKNGCDRNGGSSDRTVVISGTGGGTFKIDDSVLTCYLTNTTTSLADIASPTYNKGPVLDKSITDDPRFVWVPVLQIQPASGTSSYYSIVDVRPGFITDEQAVSNAVKGSKTGTSDNGVTVSNNGITQLKVVFFNMDAMPRDDNGDKIDYLGVGPPLVRLIK